MEVVVRKARIHLLVAVGTLITLEVHGDPFKNLGFDEPKTNNMYSASSNVRGSLTGMGPAEDLLDGWEVTNVEGTISTVGLDLNPLGIFDLISYLFSNKNSQANYLWPFEPQGKYELIMSNIESLAQTGDVPVDAKYLSFRYTLGIFAVKINGHLQAKLVPDRHFTSHMFSNQYFDVALFAGQEVRLEVICDRMSPNGNGSYAGILDSIQFLPELPPTVNFVKMHQPRMTPEGLIITWTAPVRTRFQVESAFTLNSPFWFPLGPPISSSTEVYTFTDPRPIRHPPVDFVNFQQFYRLNVLP